MIKNITLSIISILFSLIVVGQKLPVKWEEMTALEFKEAVSLSNATCIIPIGVLEKHGTHLPLGTDLLDVREVVNRATLKEYAIVFPAYIFSQIFEAQHQPGTIAYSTRIIWDVLQETCDELGRNGIKRIVLVNGHGGNNSFLPFFCATQLEKKRDYFVILFNPSSPPEVRAKIDNLMKPGANGHAGQGETSTIMAHRPDLVHMDKLGLQSGADLKRLAGVQGSTGIGWYARFPNHYAGDGSSASKELGDLILNDQADQLAVFLKQIKANQTILELQNQFFREAQDPLNTKQ
jgi:creatinine amidohydrolase